MKLPVPQTARNLRKWTGRCQIAGRPAETLLISGDSKEQERPACR
jgi:hypothetical protein